MALPNHSKQGAAKWRRNRNKRTFHEHRMAHGWGAPLGATTIQDPKSNRSKRRQSGERGWKNK